MIVWPISKHTIVSTILWDFPTRLLTDQWSPVYYRVYNKDTGAVPLHHSAGSDDLLVGRISINSIPPPHSAASIARRITKIEKLGCTGQPQLFCNISSESPLGDGHLSILTDNRPGSTKENPMAFVASIHSRFPQRIRVVYSWSQSTFELLKKLLCLLVLQGAAPVILGG